jgi:hypothetical protein
MIELDLFKRLLEKYKFTEYIPVEVQKFVLSSKKHVLISSLKSVGELNLFYRFAVSVYYNVRLIGFKPSIVISKFIALGTALLLASLLITSIVFAYNKSALQFLFNESIPIDSLLKDKAIDKSKSNKSEKEIKTKNDNSTSTGNSAAIQSKIKVDNKKSETLIKTRLGIDNIISNDADEKNALEITKELFENLQDLKGKDRVIYSLKGRDEKSINRHLLGRLSKIGKTYVMAISIVDTQSGNVLYSNTSTYNDPDNAKTIIKKIAEDINNKSSVWE